MDEGKHNFSTLLKRYTDYSYELFLKKVCEIWKEPSLKTEQFELEEKYEAIFSKPILTQLLDQLANEAEKEACEFNKVETNSKRRSFYFYQYLNSYHYEAAVNFEITDLSRDQAIEFTCTKTLNTFTLARILTYFDIIRDTTSTYPQIVKYFSEQAFPFAEKYLKEKYNINFQEPENLEDSLFLTETSFQ